MTIPAAGTYGHMVGMGGRNMFAVDFEQNSNILKQFLYPQLFVDKTDTDTDISHATE